MLGQKQRFSGYKNYVSQDLDEETLRFYNRGNQASIVGDGDFRDWVFSALLPEMESEDKAAMIHPAIPIEVVTEGVAIYYKTRVEDIRKVVKGPKKSNEARKVAMYLCQEVAGAKLAEIAVYFGLGHIGSVSFITHKIRKMKREDVKFGRKIESVVRYIVKQAT